MPVEIEGSTDPVETRFGQDFTVHEGEAVRIEVDLVDNPDISGDRIVWVLSETPNTAAEVEKDTDAGPTEIEITNENAGRFTIKIQPDDIRDLAARWYHDGRIFPGGDDETVMFTGTANILPSPTA